MRSCVSLLLLTTAIASCDPAREPTPEPAVAPLVIGTSPPPPVATSTASHATAVPDEPITAATPLAIPARDPRLAQGRNRARALVVTELQGLDALFTATPPNAPDRPVLARRIADTYAELSRVADGAVAANARRTSQKYYEVLTTEYPQYAQLDEAYYYVGLEHELAGNASSARRSYYELIRRFPSSRLIPFAYFAFGELFFAEADADPSKDQLAEQAYREVLKYPPAQNALYTEAQRRLAEIGMRKKAATTRP
jgi:TolA-binding protein